MNTLITILSLIPALIAAIKAVEEAIPEGGKGKEKLEAIEQIITVTYDAGKTIWPSVSKVIAILVDLFNKTGKFEK